MVRMKERKGGKWMRIYINGGRRGSIENREDVNVSGKR